ncbi:MAG: pyrroline-5-carboxylate reductase [Armatimonadetes bacterium]|nr:pyrroline-5-carboxylate reductase [Armatimonadota bacterium]
MDTLTIAVLGCGQMSGALVRGWVRSGAVSPRNLRLWSRSPAQAVALASDAPGAVVFASAIETVTGAGLVLLGVKPVPTAPLLASVAGSLAPGSLVVSVAAGVSLAALQAASPPSPVIRVMPNTPALVGAGAAAFVRGTHATDAHAQTVQTLFSAVGVCVEVANESLIDAVIGVAGSAPAYFYLIVEALTDGGVRAGLPRKDARLLAAQTMLGAAKMILETGTHPMVLKDAVTTPGGTTIAALGVLESAGLRGTLMDAVQAAADRSKAMGG